MSFIPFSRTIAEDIPPVGFDFILDDIPNARLAWSTARKLRSAYAGASMSVRNGASTSADIGFDENDIDESALATHVGVGDGFIEEIYSQNTGTFEGSFKQNTAVNQPYIARSGTIEKLSGFVAPEIETDRGLSLKDPIRFFGGNDDNNGIIQSEESFSFYFVADFTANRTGGAVRQDYFSCVYTASNRFIFSIVNTNKIQILLGNTAFKYDLVMGAGLEAYHMNFELDGSTLNTTLTRVSDGTTETVNKTYSGVWGRATGSNLGLSIGINSYNSDYSTVNINNKIIECVIWDKETIADISTIRTNLKNYYGI